MPQPDLDRLLIQNLGDLEAASRHLETELMPAIARAMNEKADRIFHQSGWFGIAAYDGEDIWMAPHDWHTTGGAEKDFDCWFALDTSDSKSDTVQFWLSCLLGVGPKRMGMRWAHDIFKPRAWRRYLTGQQETIARLRSRGFEFHEALGNFFLPIRLDVEALANAVEMESPESALAPFEDGLRRCIDAVGDFEALRLAAPRD